MVFNNLMPKRMTEKMIDVAGNIVRKCTTSS